MGTIRKQLWVKSDGSMLETFEQGTHRVRSSMIGKWRKMKKNGEI